MKTRDMRPHMGAPHKKTRVNYAIVFDWSARSNMTDHVLEFTFRDEQCCFRSHRPAGGEHLICVFDVIALLSRRAGDFKASGFAAVVWARLTGARAPLARELLALARPAPVRRCARVAASRMLVCLPVAGVSVLVTAIELDLRAHNKLQGNGKSARVATLSHATDEKRAAIATQRAADARCSATFDAKRLEKATREHAHIEHPYYTAKMRAAVVAELAEATRSARFSQDEADACEKNAKYRKHIAMLGRAIPAVEDAVLVVERAPAAAPPRPPRPEAPPHVECMTEMEKSRADAKHKARVMVWEINEKNLAKAELAVRCAADVAKDAAAAVADAADAADAQAAAADAADEDAPFFYLPPDAKNRGLPTINHQLIQYVRGVVRALKAGTHHFTPLPSRAAEPPASKRRKTEPHAEEPASKRRKTEPAGAAAQDCELLFPRDIRVPGTLQTYIDRDTGVAKTDNMFNIHAFMNVYKHLAREDVNPNHASRLWKSLCRYAPDSTQEGCHYWNVSMRASSGNHRRFVLPATTVSNLATFWHLMRIKMKKDADLHFAGKRKLVDYKYMNEKIFKRIDDVLLSYLQGDKSMCLSLS